MKKEIEKKTPEVSEVTKSSSARTVTIFVSIAIIAAILLGAIWAVIYFVHLSDSDAISYLEDDLTKYLVLDEGDYKGYTVEVNIPPVSDADVELLILKKLAQKKGSLLYGGHYVLDKEIAAGDLAYVRYIGYMLDEDGKRVDLDYDKYCNLTDVNPAEFEIGGGRFPVSTVEVQLVGKNPADYGKLEAETKGSILPSDVLFCTVSYTTEDDDTEHVNETLRIDLSDPDIEKNWGIGIADYLESKMIGITDFEPPTLYKKGSGEAVIFTQLRVDQAVRADGAPFVAEVKVPYDNDDVSIRGTTVYFDIYIDKTLCYERREFNSDFVENELGYNEESLASYEGDNLAEKYRAMIKENLDVIYAENYRSAAEEAMWDHLVETVRFKKLPESEISRIFDNYYYQYQTDYAANSSNSSYYGSIDAYICAQYGIPEYQDWRPILTANVEREVKEKLIFYSILRAENLIPTEEEYSDIYKKELESDFLYYLKMIGKTRDDYADDEAYNKALAEYEADILEYYGEDGYRETVYYYYASEIMLGYASIINTAE